MLSETLAEAERNQIALIEHIHRNDVSAAAHDEMTSLLAKGTGGRFRSGHGRSDQRRSVILYDGSFQSESDLPRRPMAGS